MELLKKIIYIVALLIGVILFLCAIALVLTIIYFFGLTMWHEIQNLNGISVINMLIVITIIAMFLGFLFLLEKSPDIISWAWNKLKGK